MKRLFILAVALAMAILGGHAQPVSSYTLSTDHQPWVSIASTGTQLTSVVGDYGTQTLTMPFNFDFGETTITQGTTIRVRCDGHLVLSSAEGSHYGSSYSGGGTLAIVPLLMEDGEMPAGASGCYWQVDTTDGMAVLVIEWQHVKQYGSAGDDFNFQLRLFENGNVSAHYGRLVNALGRNNFNFLLVGPSVNGYVDQIELYGTWAAPGTTTATQLGHGPGATSLISGIPDSGLVVTFVRPVPPCPRPLNFRARNLTTTDATLMWTLNGVSGCMYEIKYDSVAFSIVHAANTRPSYYTTDSVYNLSSLLPNHHYYAYVRSTCGGDSSTWQELNFWTPCYAMELSDMPFTENFDSYTGNATSDPYELGCWRQSGVFSYVGSVSGQRALWFNNCTITLPPINNLSFLEISFSIYIQSGSVEVGVLEEEGNYSSFVPLNTVSAANNTWTNRTLRLSSYEGTGNLIAFRTSGRCFIDNIDVHVAIGCPEVESMTVDNVTATTAVVSWNDPNHAGNYRVEYRPLSSTLMHAVPATASPVTLHGLQPNEDYEVRVFAICPLAEANAVVGTFHTLCAMYATPFVESFEQTEIPSCWNALGVRFYSSNHSADQSPSVCDTTATSGTHSMRLISRRTNLVGREASWVVLPETTNPVNGQTLEFDYRVPQWFENIELAVGVTTSENDTTGFHRLFTIHPADGQWHRYSFDLGFYNGTTGRIALLQDNHTDHSYAPGRIYDNGFIDSIVVDERSDCARPAALRCTNVTSSTVTISWTEMGNVGTYEVVCGSQVQMVSGDTTCVFTSLTPQTTYNVSVRQLCGDNFTTAITSSFTTECPAIATIPWSENFDSWPANSFAECWTRHESPGIYSSSSASVFNFQSVHCLKMVSNIYQGDTNYTYVVLPRVDIPYTQLSFSMNVMGFNSNSSNSRLEFGVLTDGSDPNTFIPFDTVPFTDCGFNSQDYYERALDGFVDGRLALRFTSFSTTRSVYVDNFSLFYATSCGYPNHLAVDSTSLTSLDVSVGDPDSVGHYRLWWGVDSLTDSVDITGYSHTLTGLHHSTRYQLSAATICPTDNSLSTVTSITAATDCGIISHDELPYEENYDNGIGLCSRFLDYCYPNNSGDRTNPNYNHGAAGKSLCPNARYNNAPFYYVLPEVDSLGGLALEFWHFIGNSPEDNKIDVGVMTNPADTMSFVTVETIYPFISGQWYQFHVSLGSYGGPGRHVALRFGTTGDRLASIQFVDDLSLVRDLTCLAPDSVTMASVTDSTATLVVHDTHGVGHYRVYAPADTIDFYGDTVVVGGLTGATDYMLYVASVCPEGAATFPVPVIFTTDCGIVELPYSENFESWPVYHIPRCWEVVDTIGYEPGVRSFSHAAEGEKALMGSLENGDSLLTIATPQLHFVDTDAHVAFQMYVSQGFRDANNVNNFIPMWVRVSYFDEAMARDILLFEDSVASSDYFNYLWTPVEFSTQSIPVGVGSLRFSFWIDPRVTYATFAMDSLEVYTIHHDPPCQPVDSLRVNDVTLASAVVEWTPRGPATSWLLHLFGSTVDTVMESDTHRVVLSGLEQNSEHLLVVRPLCDDGRLLWSDTVSFTTLNCPAVESVAVSITSAHTAEVEWLAPTDGPWHVEYGLSGFDQGFGTVVNVPAQAAGRMTFHLTGLTEQTSYDLYVMTLCEEGKTSVWSEPVQFTTSREGIEDTERLLFSITPNPAHGNVTLQGLEPGTAVTIRDASGRTVKEFSVQHSKYTLKIDLPAGLYFVTATAPSCTLTRKLIVK